MMLLRWWARAFGRPSIDQFAERVAEGLQARGSAPLTFDRAQRELRSADTPPRLYYLGNVFPDFARAPRRQRPEVVARFVETLVAAEESLPATYAAARAHLMPVLRGLGEDDLARLQARRSGASASEVDTFHPAARPLCGEITVGLAYDTPHMIQRLSTDHLAGWGVSFDDALHDALDNLRARPEQAGWVALAHGVWSGQWGDDYESSRLLLPDLIHRLGVVDPVVMTPVRRTLLVASARSEEALAEMARVCHEALQEQPRWLSVTPMRLGASGWVPFEPPVASAPAFAVLAAIERAERYASQKAALDDLHARDGTAVEVAPVALYRMPDGTLRSLTTWTRGPETWLPVTDEVRLVDGPSSITVRRADLLAHSGAWLRPLAMQPERMGTTGFPNEPAWTALSQRAVPAPPDGQRWR